MLRELRRADMVRRHIAPKRRRTYLRSALRRTDIEHCQTKLLRGNPPINKVEAIVRDGKVMLDNGETDSTIRVENIPDGTPVYLSFRAESVILDDKSPLKAKVVMTSVMGKEIITSFVLGGKEVRGYMNSDVELARDQEIGISFKKSGVFVFDRESGERYL